MRRLLLLLPLLLLAGCGTPEPVNPQLDNPAVNKAREVQRQAQQLQQNSQNPCVRDPTANGCPNDPDRLEP